MHAAARAHVKRVVITSSIVAMHAFPMDDLPLQSTDSWNTTSTAADGPYLASKVSILQSARAALDRITYHMKECS